jgi:hypothetical protein
MADDHQDSTYYAEYEKEKSSTGNDNNNNSIEQPQPPWTTKTNSNQQHGHLDPDQEIRQRTYYINIPIRPLTAQVREKI